MRRGPFKETDWPALSRLVMVSISDIRPAGSLTGPRWKKGLKSGIRRYDLIALLFITFVQILRHFHLLLISLNTLLESP